MLPENIPVLKLQLALLTDLEILGETEDLSFFKSESLLNYSVIIAKADTCCNMLAEKIITFDDLSLVVVDDGLYGPKQNLLEEILAFNNGSEKKTRTLGLVSGLLTDDMRPGHLEAQMHRWAMVNVF